MSTEETPAFDVQIKDNGAIEISGQWAAHTLMRIVLPAKFQNELSAEMLLSPHVRKLIDALMPVTPYPPTIDWSEPAVLMPPAFVEAVEQVRQFQAQHQPATPINDLVREALHPYKVPVQRLGLVE